MRKEIILTPEELYYMATLLQAKYMDYAYVAAMGDIQQKRGIYESESRDGLVRKGVLLEDFMGDLQVDEEARALLEPVFFGELETSLDLVITAADRRCLSGHRFHFYQGRIVSTRMLPEGIVLLQITEEQLTAWVGGMLPPDYAAEAETISAREINRKQISRIFSVKSNHIGVKTAVEIYVEWGGRIFRETEAGTAQVLTREAFVQALCRGLKGE